jgi:hypothetical protein
MPSDLHREKEFDAVIRRETQHMTGPVGIPVKVNAVSGGKPNGVPVGR